jgi:hypothetical protein
MSRYSLMSLIGYILFYLGTFLALPAAFERYDPVGLNFGKPLPDGRSTINLLRLGAGSLIWVAGGLLQLWAECC